MISEVDSLFFATFVYLDVFYKYENEKDDPLKTAYKRGELTIGMVIDALRDGNNSYAQDYLTERFIDSFELGLWRSFLDDDGHQLNASKFRDWKITNIVNKNPLNQGGGDGYSDEDRSGFVAYTFVPPDNTQSEDYDLIIIAYRGSEHLFNWDNLTTDWYDTDLDIAVGVDYSQQSKDAVEYITDILYKSDSNGHQVYGEKKAIITGHSLGGYLALIATLKYALSNELQNYLNIVRCDTFDAPGLDGKLIDIYSSSDLIRSVVINEYQNEKDIISNVNDKITAPIIVESAYVLNGFSMQHHSPFCLLVNKDEGRFIRASKMSNISKATKLQLEESYIQAKNTFLENVIYALAENGFTIEFGGYVITFTNEKDELGRVTGIISSSGHLVNIIWDEEH